jgi:hypothetical protein
MRIYIFFLLALFIFSCKQDNDVPKNIIQQDRMQELLWDMARADAFIAGFAGKGDSSFNRIKETVTLYRQIFQLHNTDREKFNKSLEWYQQHPRVLKPILDTLQNRRREIMQERSKPPTLLRIDSLRKSRKTLKP